MLYSATTRGFYTPAIHGDNIPADAVEITSEEHAAVMQGQSDGLSIGADENGRPTLIIPPPLTLAEAAAAKKAELAGYRYDKEIGGLTLPNGMMVATDDRSKTLIAGAQLDAAANPSILTDFKTSAGWVQIDAATVAIIATAVAAHVRACFSTERGHAEAIDAIAADPVKTVADIAAYDITTGWPI